MSRFVSTRRHAAGAIALGLLAIALPVSAAPAGPFDGLTGSWTGSGQVRLEDGKTEALKCKAYYTPKGGSALGLALRCASASNKIELRASLSFAGGRVSGEWEERSFNASGTVSGQTTGDSMRLSISGGGFSGSMVVKTSGGSQSISMAAQGVALKGVNITLKRDGS